MPRLPRVYAIVDAELAAGRGWAVPDLARAYLAGGIRLVQIRAKQASSSQLLEWSAAVVAAARPVGALVIVNDRPDIARLAGADGVHVGQDDLPPAEARAIVGPDVLVGMSTHTAAQIEAALLEPVSYLAVGPVFDTTTKETGYAAVGSMLVGEAADRAGSRPVVALGGITLERAPDVIAAGAAAVAVISDLLTSDPEARAREYVRRVGH